jgi:hypothetical protein
MMMMMMFIGTETLVTQLENERSRVHATIIQQDPTAEPPVDSLARPLVPEPAETLREDNQAAQTRASRQPVSQPPVD